MIVKRKMTSERPTPIYESVSFEADEKPFILEALTAAIAIEDQDYQERFSRLPNLRVGSAFTSPQAIRRVFDELAAPSERRLNLRLVEAEINSGKDTFGEEYAKSLHDGVILGIETLAKQSATPANIPPELTYDDTKG